MTRRQLLAGFGGFVATVGSGALLAAAKEEKKKSTFEGVGLNHLALRVTDVARSRDFYIKHLGLRVSRESENNCFLTCGNNFVALFRGDKAGMDHYCYSIKGYDVDEAEKKLKAEGFKPRVHRAGKRIYFKDPDGLTVQLSSEHHRSTREREKEKEKKEKATSTFEGVGLNHIALQVTDVPRSRDFYTKHLGLKVARQGANNCFLTCGKNFVALFRSDEAQMDHYCYSIKDYDVDVAEKKLKAEGFNPRVHREGKRIYFKDPDGLTVQLSSEKHEP